MAQLPSSHLRLADLSSREPTAFDLSPTAQERAAVADALGIIGIRKLRFSGTLAPLGRSDWELKGDIGATVVQACVVTLDPVATRIDEAVRRSYMADLPDVEANEIEMPEDDTIEALPAALDLAAVMIEALALALPPYPRAEGADLGETVYTEPGKQAMTDEQAKPFAGLAGLRDSLENKGD
ncbi:YceD family protein [Loktanella agnita]|uniref:YceD family protein n=1 Tax=Loktanella agnita TaxID=287097 RepID=UPI003988329A